MKKYVRINNITFPLQAADKIWQFVVSSITYHLSKVQEIEMLRWCMKSVPEQGRERKKFFEDFYAATLKLNWTNKCYFGASCSRPLRAKTFKNHFLKAHGIENLPQSTSLCCLIGLALFSIGCVMFNYWNFMLLAGWSGFEWPIATIVLLSLGFCMALKRIVKYTTDLSVHTYGMFDLWLIVMFVCYFLGFAVITRSVKQKTLEEMSFVCEGIGSVGGFISLVVSAIMIIPCVIWAVYNLWELYKALNAKFFGNTYKIQL